MPYVAEEHAIKTKVIGIATKINDGDTLGVRQVVMQEMYDDPSTVRLFYLRKREVWVSLDNGREFYLGDVKAKYEQLIMENVTQIVSWQITGGQTIPETRISIAGHPTVKCHEVRAKFGLNIQIKLL